MIAVRQRDAGVARNSARRRDARDDLEWQALVSQRLDLLAAPSEDERIATLEPHHAPARAGQADQQRTDLGLRHDVVATLLAGIDALGVHRNEVEHLGGDQVVVDHDIGLAEHAHRAQRQQLGVARASADQIDAAGRGLVSQRLAHHQARKIDHRIHCTCLLCLSYVSRAPSDRANRRRRTPVPPPPAVRPPRFAAARR